MVGQKIRIAIVGLTFSAFSASPAHAFFHWFKGCCGTPAPATAYYAPPVAAPCGACAPAPQVVNYMPQTCYRTVYVNSPVVAYQPVTTCNPCTGCPQTVMRPVTTFVTQARVVPYTTYRPVVAAYAPACSTGCGAAPAITAAYAPAAVAPAPVAAPAPCCQASYSAPAVAAPMAVTNSVIQQPVPMAPPQGQVVSPLSASQPSAPPATNGAPPSGASPNRTFSDQPSNEEPRSRIVEPQSSLRPNSFGAPRALDSEDQDRTTYLPHRQTLAARPVSARTTMIPTTHITDESGWRSTSR